MAALQGSYSRGDGVIHAVAYAAITDINASVLDQQVVVKVGVWHDQSAFTARLIVLETRGYYLPLADAKTILQGFSASGTRPIPALYAWLQTQPEYQGWALV